MQEEKDKETQAPPRRSGTPESLDWEVSEELLRNIPVSPRLDASSPRRLYAELVCTPRPGPNDTAVGNSDEQGCEQFEAMQSLLIEQRRELHAVATVFGDRLAALCQEMYRQSLQKPLPANASQSECSVQLDPDVVLGSSHGDGKHTQASNVKDVKDVAKTWARSFLGMQTRPLNIDFQMVRGWMDCEPTSSASVLSKVSWQKRAANHAAVSKVTRGIVDNKFFDALSISVIVLHSILMGAAADISIKQPGQAEPDFFKVADLVFLACYISEIFLRVCAEGYEFVFSPWNLFDSIVVGCDTVSQIMFHVAAGDSHKAFGNVVTARAFRVFRVLRAMRVIRLVRFFRELRMMIKCMIQGVKTILWVMLLLLMFIYVFAVYLLEQVADGVRDESDLSSAYKKVLKFRFGTLADACLSLFMSISGGISWVEITDPLISIHWTNGIVFFIFIFFTVFAILNIVTGVFVDYSLTAARSDDEEVIQDIIHDEDSHLKKIRQVFETANENKDDHLTLQQLEKHLGNPEIRILFKSIGIKVHEVNGLFRLLDLDNSGTVTLEEFLVGCMRLREGTNSVDMCTLLYENKRLLHKFKNFVGNVEKQFESVHEHLAILEQS